MIKTEMRTINGREFVYTVSDSGYMIERDGARYSEAYDPVGTDRVYVETDELIDTVNEDATEADYIAALHEMGVDTDEEG
jgi:hypothetical protein